MANHIPTIGILLIVQGVLEGLLGLFVAAMGPVMFAIIGATPPSTASPPPDPAALGIVGGLYLVVGVVVLALGVLKVFAGIRNLSFRSRVLGIVALASGALSFITCYCAPTALALAVFGLIVYLNEASIAAFRMGDEGRSAAEIRAHINRPPSSAQWQRKHFE